MSDNVVQLHGKDPAEDPDVVLERCVGAYQSVVVLGWTPQGTLDMRASLNLSSAEALWLLKIAERALLDS